MSTAWGPEFDNHGPYELSVKIELAPPWINYNSFIEGILAGENDRDPVGIRSMAPFRTTDFFETTGWYR